MKKNNCVGSQIKYRMLIVHGRIMMILLTIMLACLQSNAQYSFEEDEGVTGLTYDEIPVLVMVEGYKSFYSEALYTSNDTVYFNIVDLFSTLNISCKIAEEGNILSGFIENNGNPYFIDFNAGMIKVGSRVFDTKNRLVKIKGMLYIESSLLYESFGLKLVFNYRTLSAVLKSDFELPVIKQLRLEKNRNNIMKIEGKVLPDTTVKRNYHLFKPGIIDWSVASFQSLNGPSNNQFTIGAGTELLFGEADFSLYYNDLYRFDYRQLHYLWRWIDNDKKIIRQAQVGKFSNNTISFLNAPIIGAVIRNSPTTLRQAKGYFTITDITEPNWTVELYLNDEMVDFTTTDASGLYIFKVPNIYGYITLKLKFYGPMGEERTEERTMNMPYTILPENELEYSLSGGYVQDSSWSRLGRAEFNYGLTRFITLGGGVEYLSSIPNYPYIPFINATVLPLGRLIISGEYAHRVRIKGLLDYYFAKNALIELDYSKFHEGQLATRFNALEERKIKLSVPYRYRRLAGYSKLDFTQLVYKTFNFYQANLVASVYYKQFNSNLSTQLNWVNNNQAFLNTNLATSYRFKQGYLIRPSFQYNITGNQLITFKVDIEKSIPKGYFTFSYQRDAINKEDYLNLNFKYDLDFARTNLNVSYQKGGFLFSESAQGSLAFGGGNGYVQANKNSSTAKGGILLYPYLDLNNNNQFDKDEHLIKVESVKVMGGKTIVNKKDSIIRVADLNAFTYYTVEFDNVGLDNISWRFKYNRYKVLVDPNQFKRIDVPVISVGEVSGMAYKNIDNSLKGIGRILVKFYKKGSQEAVAETISESDGYFNYIGLEPGEYIARIDSTQLSNLAFAVNPQLAQFTIKSSLDGDIVSDLNFILETGRLYAQNTPGTVIKEGTEIRENKVDTKPRLGQIVSDSEIAGTEKAETKDSESEQGFIYEGEKYPSWIKIIPVGDEVIQPIKNQQNKQIESVTDKSSEVFVKEGEKYPSLIQINPVMKDSTVLLEKLESKQTKTNPDNSEGVHIYEGQKYPSSIRIIQVEEDISSKSDITETKLHEKKVTDGQLAVVIDTAYNNAGETLYKVQLLATSKPVKINEYFSRLLSNVPGLKIFETQKGDGLIRYNTGAFKDNAEARELMKLIRENGWKDCFLATYTDEKPDEKIFRLKRNID